MIAGAESEDAPHHSTARIRAVCVLGVLILVACFSAGGGSIVTHPKVVTRSVQIRFPPLLDPLIVPAIPQSEPATPFVDLWAKTGATIAFAANNGRVRYGTEPERFELPYLVLFRNGQLTSPRERTIHMAVRNFVTSQSGVRVAVDVETQHSDPDAFGPSQSIPIWHDSQWVANLERPETSNAVALFTFTFGPTTSTGADLIPTPTDYYQLRVSISEGREATSYQVYEVDYAFLLESQWIASLPSVAEEVEGAAPDEMVIHYCDMFPFQQALGDRSSRLPRRTVSSYVANNLVPAMVSAFQLQSDNWGLIWHKEWTSCRSEGSPKRLIVVLSDGTTWYHGPAPYSADWTISITINDGDNAYYASLTDGIISALHHELFHQLQRGIRQHEAGSSDINGKNNAWAFFAEGTAVLAASVAQPDVHFAPSSTRRMYLVQANNFLGGINLAGGSLNSSVTRMNPYQSALYWRFLYEKCSGMESGGENARSGMAVIKQALELLYSGEIVDIDTSSNLVQALPAVLDQALAATPSCPFHTFQESRRQFAKAIYSLRLHDGRCTEPGHPVGCGFFDPNLVYEKPTADELIYSGVPTLFAGHSRLHPAGIASSFGIDFVNVYVEPTVDRQQVALEVRAVPRMAAVFDVQVLRLDNSSGGLRLGSMVKSGTANESRPFRATLETEPGVRERFVLILLRQDTEETIDPSGLYTILLQPESSQ